VRALTNSLANSDSESARDGERYERRTIKVVSRLPSLYRTVYSTCTRPRTGRSDASPVSTLQGDGSTLISLKIHKAHMRTALERKRNIVYAVKHAGKYLVIHQA